jgi:dinuclear metal center YbgI/SA1388 family protein
VTHIREIAAYLDTLLETAATPDYPSALNGLQLENEAEIHGIAAAVDFSSRAIDGGIAANTNLLIVHHGMFWGGLTHITGPTYGKLRKLIDSDVAVYSSHLPLDRHPAFGNNVLLARELGLEPTQPFAKFENIHIGIAGKSDIDTAAIMQRAQNFSAQYGGIVRHTPIRSGQRTRHWAICTGAGASADTLAEAQELGVDTLIAGEGPHWTAVHAEEYGLVIIYAGHYATETLGVRAIATHLAEKYHLPWSFISAPTGL